ncbi:MAG: hypothetical protein WCF19_02770 [Chlamydiales bacterium]
MIIETVSNNIEKTVRSFEEVCDNRLFYKIGILVLSVLFLPLGIFFGYCYCSHRQTCIKELTTVVKDNPSTIDRKTKDLAARTLLKYMTPSDLSKQGINKADLQRIKARNHEEGVCTFNEEELHEAIRDHIVLDNGRFNGFTRWMRQRTQFHWSNSSIHNHLTRNIDPEYREHHNKYLQSIGFTLLDNNGKILTHPNLGNWVLKGGADYDQLVGRNRSNAMRVVYADQMGKIIDEEGLNVLKVPQKKLIPSGMDTGTVHDDFYVIAEKLDLLDKEETQRAIENLPEAEQQTLACQLCRLIALSSFEDCTFENMRMVRGTNTIAVIDTESRDGPYFYEPDDKPLPYHAKKHRSSVLIAKKGLENLNHCLDHAFTAQSVRNIFRQAIQAEIERFDQRGAKGNSSPSTTRSLSTSGSNPSTPATPARASGYETE